MTKSEWKEWAELPATKAFFNGIAEKLEGAEKRISQMVKGIVNDNALMIIAKQGGFASGIEEVLADFAAADRGALSNEA